MNFVELTQGIATAELNDLTDIKTGGQSRGLLPTGTAFVRFTGYVEYGKQPQSFNGKPKDPALEFALRFHFVGGVGINKEGNEEDYVQNGICPTKSTFSMAESNYAKSQCVKVFNAINVAPKTATHFLHKLGQLYTVNVSVTKNKKTGADQNSVDWATLQPATNPATRKPLDAYVNAAGEEVGLTTVPDDQYQVFLWNRPSSLTDEQYKAMWDSIHIEGVSEAKVDAQGNVTVPAKSKNYMQEKCQSALDFEGSAIQALIGGARIQSLVVEESEIAPPDTTSAEDDVPSGVVEAPALEAPVE